MSDKRQDPCELNLVAFYKDKNPQQIKSSLNYFKSVRGNIKDTGELRNFINKYAEAKGLETSSRLLAELDTIGKHAITTDKVMNPKWNKDHLQAMLSGYEESSSVVPGAGINAERTIEIKKKAFWGSFDREMSGIGFSKEFSSGQFDKQIREVIRSGKPYVGTNALEINQAAGIIKKAYSVMNHELNTAGMRTAYRADYDGPLVHDGSQIYGKFKEWVTALDKGLNFVKEFPEVPEAEVLAFQQMIASGNLPEKASNQAHKILEFSYKNITDTESALRDEMPRSLERPVSIAERRSYAKSFTTWKSGAAITEYLAEFGKYKTLAEQMQYYSRSAARDVGLVTQFGGSPFKGHEMNKDLLKKLMTLDRKTPVEIADAQKTLDIAWNNLTRPQIPDPGTLGKISINGRMAMAQAKLGMAGFTSLIMDPVSTTIQHRNLMQEGIIKALWDSYSGMIGAAKTASRGDIEDSHLFSQYDLSTTWDEFVKLGGGIRTSGDRIGSALQFSGEMVSKGSGAYFFNKVAHINNAKMYMKFLADAANGKTISPIMEADLDKFHITTDDLDVIKGLDLGGERGMRNLFDLTPEQLMDMNPKISSVTEARNNLTSLQNRMNSWLLEKIKTGAPQVGNRERRLLHGDTVAGSLEGEIRRILTQFKSTQTKVFIDTTYGANRRLNPEGMQAGKVEWRNKENMYNMGAMAFLLTSAGAANMFINAMVAGDEKQLDRWSKGDPKLLLEAFARGGAGNILGDLMQFKSNKAEELMQVIGSPALTGAVTPFSAAATAADGNVDRAALDMFKTFTPGANMWFLKPFIQGMSDAAGNSKKRHSNNSSDPLK